MPKTESKSLTDTQGIAQEPEIKLKIGAHATINSTHPLFPGMVCTVTANPSSDAVIVEFENGDRVRLLLEYLDLLEQDPLSNSSNELGEKKLVQPCIQDPSLRTQNTDKQMRDCGGNNSSGNSLGWTNFSRSASDPASVDITDLLTPDEERERHRLEIKVERAFYEAGCALRDLRDKRLYRSTHNTFEEYCQDRFGYTRRNANYTIAAAAVVENLGKILSQNDSRKNLGKNGTQILPTNSEQVRHLTKLQPKEQQTAWQQAVDLADGKVPTGKIVKGVVERMKQKPLFLASDYCEMGEVFFLTRLHGEEHKYNGCWAIAIEVENRFTVKAATYKGALEVRPENIERIDCEQTQAEIRDIHQRLTQLTKCQLDPIDEAQIEILCRRPWFTDRQKQALSTMEEVYQVKVKP